MSPTLMVQQEADPSASLHITRLALAFLATVAVYSIAAPLYGAFFGPLSKYPGPKINALTAIPRLWNNLYGDEVTYISGLHRKYGPIVRVAPNDISFISGAAAWKDIHGFKKAGEGKPYKHPLWYVRPINGVASLIMADDATHSRQRKILSHAFSDRALKEQEPMLRSWTEKLTEKLSAFAASGDKVDMLKMLNCTTFDIMGDLSFNEGLNMLDGGEYSPWVKTIFASIKEFVPLRIARLYSPVTRYIVDYMIKKNPRVRAKGREHWNYIAERVDRRLRKTPERPDLWSRILAKGSGPDGLTIEEHKSNASLFMIAGTETTATALSGLIYFLITNPDKYAKLNDEVRSEIKSAEGLTLESLARLKYLHACLMEALRMYPPVPAALPRAVPPEGAVICGEFMPGGTTIGVSQKAMYNSPLHFKNPDKFHPERWLDDPEYVNDHRDALEPFSFGPRNCLGKNLAWHEMRLIISSILLDFDMTLAAESNNWVDQKVYTLWEKVPLICTLTPVNAQ